MNHYNIMDLLDFLYNKFMISFIICVFGSFSRDVIDTIKNHTKLNVGVTLVTALFGGVITCMILDIADNISFGEFVFLAYFIGLWSYQIFNIVTNKKFAKIISIGFNKASKLPKEVTSSIEQIAKEVDQGEDNTNKNEKATESENANSNK